MSEEIRKLTAKELVEGIDSGKIKCCTYSTKAELYEGMREHAAKIS